MNLPTSNCEPCTKGEPEYKESSGDNNFLRLADSEGIDKEKGIDSVIQSTKNFVLKQLNNNEPDKFVHCIWYCINGPRFEDVEINNIIKISNLYGNSRLPVIVVYTQALQNEHVKGIKEKINKLHLNLGFIDIVAKNIEVGPFNIPPTNLDNLKQLSIDKAADAIRSSCYTFLQKNISDYVKDNLQNQKNKIRDHISSKIKEKIDELTCGIDISYIINIIAEIILEIIKIYTSEENTGAPMTPQGSALVTEFLDNIFKETMNSLKKNLPNFIKEKVEYFTKDLISLILRISKQYSVNLYQNNFEEDLKTQLKEGVFDRIKIKYESYCLKNTAKFITKIVNEKMGTFIENKYRKILESEDIEMAFIGEAMKKFVEFDKKITPS